MNQRVMGLLLFLAGIIMALISAAKLPLPDANWSDMLSFSVGAMVLALGGLLLLHWCQTSLGNNQDKQSDPLVCAGIIELLQALATEMQDLGKEINNSDQQKIVKQVNRLLDEYVLPLAAAQQEVICLLGQSQGVEVLVAAAQGERLLNRMWSAACDGNLTETIATYPKALAAFEMAYRHGQNIE